MCCVRIGGVGVLVVGMCRMLQLSCNSSQAVKRKRASQSASLAARRQPGSCCLCVLSCAGAGVAPWGMSDDVIVFRAGHILAFQ